MKYCVIGAGGCGGSIAGFMACAGKDVALIARGEHLAAIQNRGLALETTAHGRLLAPVRAVAESEYREQPDVVFVCVKEYSLPDILPFLQRITGEETVVIPILNIYGTGERLQRQLPKALVTDGCIYIAAHKSAPGEITLSSDIFRVVYGARDPESVTPERGRRLLQTARDLRDARIEATVSDSIRRDTLQKYSLISPMAACGLYYDIPVGRMQEAGEPRALFEDLVREIERLAEALGKPFLIDAVKTNLDIIDGMKPDAAASVQRDVWNGGPSEMEGLVRTPLQMGEAAGIDMPRYRMVAEKLGLTEEEDGKE